MRRFFLVFAAVLVCLGVSSALAQNGSVQVTLSPDRPSAASTLEVKAQGPFKQPTSGQVTSVRLEVQRGFTSSAKSVASLCSPPRADKGTCPSESQVGSGSALVSGQVNGISGQDTINFKLFLAVPERTADIASVVIEGSDTVFHRAGHTRGRLFRPSTGGLVLLFKVGTSGAPKGAKITLDRLALQAGAMRSVVIRRHGHRRHVKYSLITNPSSCTGSWHGAVVVTFSSGEPDRRPVAVGCRAG
jgi:hypothetical protein